MEIKEIIKKSGFANRFYALFLDFIGKFYNRDQWLIFYFCESDLRISGAKISDGVIYVNELKIIRLPEDVYNFRAAKILDIKKLISLFQEEKKKTGKKISARKSILILPQECFVSKIIPVSKSNAQADPGEYIKEVAGNQFGGIISWKKINMLDAKDSDHDDFLAEIQEEESAKYFYRSILKGFKSAPRFFVSEAEAIVNCLFPDGASFDANLIVKADEKRILFLVFAGCAVQFSLVDFMGISDFEKNEKAMKNFIEKSKGVIDFYKNQVFHEHGASPFVNKIILLGGSKMKNGLMDRFALAVKLKIDLVDATSFFGGGKNEQKIEFPKEFDYEQKARSIPVLGAIRGLAAAD